jgi:hypothetical protein
MQDGLDLYETVSMLVESITQLINPLGAGHKWEHAPQELHLTPHSPEEIKRLVAAAEAVIQAGTWYGATQEKEEKHKQLNVALEPFTEGE